MKALDSDLPKTELSKYYCNKCKYWSLKNHPFCEKFPPGSCDAIGKGWGVDEIGAASKLSNDIRPQIIFQKQYCRVFTCWEPRIENE